MTLADIEREVQTQLADNTSGQITPAKLRAVILLIILAIREGIDR
jgi:hypothetical protein